MKKWLLISCIVSGVLLISSFGKKKEITEEQLGEMLFFDPVLSADRTISCASCHKPESAFADTTAFSAGVHGKQGRRNTPSVMNMSARESFFWDGRAATLEEQALFPIEDPDEMNLPLDTAIERLNKSKKYRMLFLKVFGVPPDRKALGAALAAFERTLETSNTANDRWLQEEPNGMTAQQIRGRTVFREKGKCFDCHFTPDFTGDEFRSIGLFDGKKHNDSGRYALTQNPEDLGRFKVPGLRNVAVTAPYMHDGSMKTLREVIDYYDNPLAVLPGGMNRDTVLREPLGLTEPEKQDLEAFLHALTDDRFLRKD